MVTEGIITVRPDAPASPYFFFFFNILEVAASPLKYVSWAAGLWAPEVFAVRGQPDPHLYPRGVGAGSWRGGCAAIGGSAVRTPGEEKVQENGPSCQGARCNGTSGRGVGTFCGHEAIPGLTRIYKKTKTYIYIYSHLLSLTVFIELLC